MTCSQAPSWQIALKATGSTACSPTLSALCAAVSTDLPSEHGKVQQQNQCLWAKHDGPRCASFMEVIKPGLKNKQQTTI